MQRPLLTLAKRAGLSLLSAALPALVLAELGARRVLHNRGGYYRYAPYMRERREFDRVLHPTFPAEAMFEVNRDGERGGPPPRAGERCWRALVVGGSAAECYFLDQHATWAAVVERELRRPESLAALGVPRVHVGIVARAILTCEQLTLMLSKVLPRYRRLDAILVMVGAADIVSWIERGMPSSIPEGPLRLDKIFEQHPEGPWGHRPRETALWGVLARARRAIRRPLVVERDSSGWLRDLRAMRRAAPVRVDEEPDATPALRHFETHLERLLRVAQTHADRVILVHQPWLAGDLTPEEEALVWNFGLGRPYRERVEAYFTPRVVEALMKRVDASAASVAHRMGVEELDLLPAFERSARTFYDELHFTPLGAELVGRAVAEAIVRPHLARTRG